eukprot:96804_1
MNGTDAQLYDKSNVSTRYLSYAQDVAGSKWNIYVYQNNDKRRLIVDVCMIDMPSNWLQMYGFSSIACCQIACRYAYNISFSRTHPNVYEEDWCFDLDLSPSDTDTLWIMQFMELKLEITISITDILDNYTHAIYKNFLTWNEYKANEDFKHNSIDWQCFVNENIAAMKSLLSELLDILEVVMTIFIGIIRQIIIMLLMTTFLHQAKIFYIKRMISTKRKLNKKCAWMRCNRSKKKFRLYICGGCRSTYYCGTSHQKKHWKYVHHRQCF